MIATNEVINEYSQSLVDLTDRIRKNFIFKFLSEQKINKEDSADNFLFYILWKIIDQIEPVGLLLPQLRVRPQFFIGLQLNLRTCLNECIILEYVFHHKFGRNKNVEEVIKQLRKSSMSM